MKQQQLTTHQFGLKSENYLSSPVHAAGADLERLTSLAKRLGAADALDLGCGAGHAAYALARSGTHRVVACDPAPEMLALVAREAQARGHSQIRTHQGAAESLPFPDASFDLVVTRFSAHHWSDVPRALTEVARVLKPSGTFVAIDVLAPEAALMDTVLQALELLRDASHVRDYRESEWRAMFAAVRLSEPVVARWKLPMDFAAWVARIGTPAARIAALRSVFSALPTEALDYFSLEQDESFAIDAGWMEAQKFC